MPVVLQLFLLQQKAEAYRIFHVQSDKVGSKKKRRFLFLSFNFLIRFIRLVSQSSLRAGFWSW